MQSLFFVNADIYISLGVLEQVTSRRGYRRGGVLGVPGPPGPLSPPW